MPQTRRREEQAPRAPEGPVLTLKIGRISYTNLFPIFAMLQHGAGCSRYEFYDGVPSALNALLRKGAIDVSPSSSIEYLRHPGRYSVFENHSVSSRGPVRSILLFSKHPIGELSGQTVAATSESETSVALLRIILRKFYKLDVTVSPTSEPLRQAVVSHAAYLSIGDEALGAYFHQPVAHRYDLGEIWYRETGLPFTFALWLFRKDCSAGKGELIGQFAKNLDRAKAAALRNLAALAPRAPLAGDLPEAEIIAFWKGISYHFGDDEKKGFALFRQYADELGLLEPDRPIPKRGRGSSNEKGQRG